MRYFITGSKGQLGYDLKRELEKRGEHDILSVDYENLDITNRQAVLKLITDHNPDVVFHCAAWTQVDNAEDEEKKDLCFDVNVNGTKYVAEACEAIEGKLVYISTDYVFDGTKEGLYEIGDRPNPLSVYGKTKYLGELEAQKAKKHFIVRASWVFGINGHNFIKTMLKLSETKNELKIIGDQIGGPTYTVDLARLLVDMIQTEKYGVYHGTNEGFCSWAEFAEYIFKTNEKNVKVNYIPTSEYPTKATRPLNSKLSKQSLTDAGFKLLPTWQEAVDRYNIELRSKGE